MKDTPDIIDKIAMVQDALALAASIAIVPWGAPCRAAARPTSSRPNGTAR